MKPFPLPSLWDISEGNLGKIPLNLPLQRGEKYYVFSRKRGILYACSALQTIRKT